MPQEESLRQAKPLNGSILLGLLIAFFASAGRAQASEVRCDNASLAAEPINVIPVCSRLLAADGIDAKTRAGLLYILGRGYHRTNRIAEAIENYDAALALDSSSADIFVSRAWAAMELKDGDGMVHFAQEAIKADPTSARAWDMMGAIRAELGNPVAALEAYDHALRVDPKYSLALLHRGEILIRMGRPDRAVEDYETILAMPPAEVETGNLIGQNGKPASFRAAAFEGRANARWNSASLDAVETDLRAAIATEATPFRHRQLAQHFRRQPGRMDEAVGAIRAAYDMAPYLIQLQHELGEYLLYAGKEEEGLAELERVIKKAPGYMNVHSTTVIYFQRKNRIDEAVNALVAGYNANPRSYLWLLNRLVKGGYWDGKNIPEKITPKLKAAFRKCLAAKCA
ncbi:tetratricopeptide repeat protein [Rhabdaerophilum sp. SD176]|uniref:tetratricopeptide repeat protein n=1 Tax=Rhabdaerophilum sp. SD176 TaxID=2983548 RepID=UPI0024DFD5C2|nr:tetratricopeptide repeat protein [Rhabdaerophilum sp. SD176]